ncbi:MAG: phosphatase PAP2 family protein [Polyangiaceae bacterium]|nr:phosphatase PAP2 family protein [Polyangiaceae bacterium]
MFSRRIAALGLSIALALAASVAGAEPPLATPAPSPPAVKKPDKPKEPPLVWTGRDLHIADYAITGAFLAGAVVETLLPVGNDPKRAGGVLFDDAARDVMVLHRPVDRATADSFSDVFLFALSAYPAIDAGASAWLYRSSPRVAWNMFIIDMQALSFTYLVTGGIKRIADRARPIAGECEKDMSHDPTCGTVGSHYSFLSGHTSMSFTGAGLVCLHHSQLALLGTNGDVLSCVGSITMASIVGLSRIAADKHYASDVISGAALGLFSGALMPYLLYYLPGKSPAALKVGGGFITPVAGQSFLGATWAGAL